MNFSIYIDGSCEPNPGLGGWGLLLISEKDTLLSEYVGGERKSTNNRMEISALIAALELTKDHPKKVFTIYTDSKLACETYNTWMHGWAEKDKFHEKANPDLTLKLYDLHKHNEHVKVNWVRGHNGNKWNEEADILASVARSLMGKGLLKELDKKKVRTKPYLDLGD